jgi:hypothetical protein
MRCGEGVKLRDAAALLIEQGKALGRAEQALAVVQYASGVAVRMRHLGNVTMAEPVEELSKHVLESIPQLERQALTAQAHAEQLMAELEHPGALLARRLVASARAARAAWRGSR